MVQSTKPKCEKCGLRIRTTQKAHEAGPNCAQRKATLKARAEKAAKA